MKIIHYLLPLLFINISFAEINYDFSKLSLSDGLPSTIVRDITQDSTGFMWFGTRHGVVKFDGYQVTQINDAQGQSLGDIWSILEVSDGSIFIASKTKGLFKYQSGLIRFMPIFDNKVDIELTSMGLDEKNTLWLGTNEGVYKLVDEKLVRVGKLNNDTSHDFINLDKSYILGQTKQVIYKFDLKNSTKEQVEVLPADDRLNSTLYKDNYDTIWLGRKNGLYAYDKQCQCFKSRFKELKEINVYSLVSDQKYLWIGTVYKGLYRYSYENSELVKVSMTDNDNESLGKTIVSLYIDRSSVLWIGTFNAGIYYINPSIRQFSSISKKNKSIPCAKSFTVHDVIETRDKSLWLATEKGLVRITKKNKCTLFMRDESKNSLTANPLLNIYQASNDDIWILNNRKGFDRLSTKTKQIDRIGNAFGEYSFFFSVEYNQNELLLGSFKNGLYVYNITEKKLTQVKNIDKKFDKATFYTYAVNNKNYYLGTNKGLLRLNNMKLEKVTLDGRDISEISALSFDHDGALWISANFKSLLKKNKDGSVEDITPYLKHNNTPIQVRSIVLTDKRTIWLSTNNGLYKLDTKTYENWHFTSQDGLQNADFFRNSYHQNNTGKLYFGGQKGVNSFNPSEITVNKTPPVTVLTSFLYFNKLLNVGKLTESEFKLNKPINYLDKIELGYKDYIIGFGFAALDYADSMRNQYAYRLKGLNDDWVYVDANDRKVTYTNLKSGHYTFQVKAANKDGIWNKVPTELKIKVHPAPWLSPWAYVIYIIIIMAAIWTFIRYKTIASRKRAKVLEVTVAERTQEVNMQKKMVESLLDHKNEVFANITHEFKTPLALILGPAKQLEQKSQSDEYKNNLSMIQRNAKRLILMVGQILKLSQAELNKETLRESQAVKPILMMLYEAFKPLAEEKNIKIHLESQHSVSVYATAECLEIVIGNLISNALKFTNSGGEIYISSLLNDKQISISVRDTGTGIEKKDLSKIFKRFTRLDTHKNIQGTGIGLSVVKEITEANNGEVKIYSEWGKGSEFTVIFPITEIVSGQELSKVMVDQLVGNTKNELIESGKNVSVDKNKLDKKRITVLIIEDNLDMQSHIGNVLKQRFNCTFADRGRKGIGLALQEVPDIIICDVMMPGMDGYQVTRIIRHDTRTSHIPIVLLTALNTKESRIKGWRENIDTYIAKPFDATELNVQLDNILTIRSILQNKTNKAIKNNTALNTLDLPLQDQKFIEQLKNVISEYYVNEYFQIADIALKMAISDRQLQRKVKALINQTPMDLLRNHRLEKAALKLRDGYQVGIVSDECGFSSFSYFSSCFKKKYGVPPKKYQQLGKRK